MSQFEPAVEWVLAQEGNYSNDSSDAGGETRFGISKASHPNVDIANLTRDGAIAVYQSDYWKPVYEQIHSQELVNRLFSFVVNMGAAQGHRLLQRALGIAPDGVIGAGTLNAANNANPIALLIELRAQAAFFYATLAAAKPDNRKFLLGWLRRAVA